MDDIFYIQVAVDTAGDSVNAVKGNLTLPTGFKTVSLSTADSVVDVWLEAPHEEASGTISWQGIIPHGFAGVRSPFYEGIKPGPLFTIAVRGDAAGADRIHLQGESYLNDGKGTLSTNARQIAHIGGAPIRSASISDQFLVKAGTSETVASGKWFVSFADDSHIPVDHYEVAETGSAALPSPEDQAWHVALSPYVLADQSRRSFVHIKSVGASGSARETLVYPEQGTSHSGFAIAACIIIVSLALFIAKHMKKSSTLFLLLVASVSASFIISDRAFAADLLISPASGVFAPGKPFSAQIFLGNNTEAVNAFSGTISFPASLLSVSSIAKDPSIVKLWYSEPVIDNQAGTVHFEGVVPNPGYSAASGELLTINFMPKLAGDATILFKDGSVLANDGKGTNVLRNLGNARLTIASGNPVVGPESSTPAANPLVPAAPHVYSLTHTDPAKWYSSSDPVFKWDLPSDATAVRISYDDKPNSVPSVVYEPAISTKSLSKVADGIHYFHVQVRNKIGWGSIAHFPFKIDSVAPNAFTITFPHGATGDNPQPIIYFNTPDALSGIDHYEIKIGDGNLLSFAPEALSNPYSLPAQPSGHHTVLVRAIDKAGNSVSESADFEIDAIEPPKLTYYPDSIQEGDTLKMRGTTYPNATINAYLTDDRGDTTTDFSKSNSLGDFGIAWAKRLDPGVYKLTLETVDDRGATSPRTDPVTVEVVEKPFAKLGLLVISYLSLIIIIVASLAILVGFLWFVFARMMRLKRRIRADLSLAETALLTDLQGLQMEVRFHIEELRLAKGKRVLSAEEQNILKGFQKKLSETETTLKKHLKLAEKDIN